MNYQNSFRDTCDKNMVSYGARNMFMYMDGAEVKNITFASFCCILKDIKAILDENKITAGDRVAVISPTNESYEALAVAFAYYRVVLVPIDYNLPAEEKLRLLKLAEVSLVFTDIKYADDICNDSYALYILKSGCKYEQRTEIKERKAYDKSDEDVQAVLFSSGTTGTVKGVEVTCKGVTLGCVLMQSYAQIVYTDKYLNALPLSHIAGYLTSLAIVYVGACNCFLPVLNPQTLLSAFKTYEPTCFEMVPEVFELLKSKSLMIINRKPLVKAYYKMATGIVRFSRTRLSKNPKFLTKPIYKEIFGPSMRYMAGGAAPFTEELIRFYLDLGLDLGNVYGSTECCFPIAGFDARNIYEYKGVGKCDKFKEVEVKINNPDENGIGEIYVKTELIMKGYYKDPKLTEAAFDGEWFKTGDAGYIDEDHVLYIKGRIKDNMVLSNGEKVTPDEIDNYYRLENAKVASVGIPSEKGFDEIHLFIESDKEELKKIIAEKAKTAPKNYKLKEVHLIDKIPVTTTGKIKRFELRKMGK